MTAIAWIPEEEARGPHPKTLTVKKEDGSSLYMELVGFQTPNGNFHRPNRVPDTEFFRERLKMSQLVPMYSPANWWG
jgi:hypothetical protein